MRLIEDVIEEIDPRFPLIKGKEPFGYVFLMKLPPSRKQRAFYGAKSEDVSCLDKYTYPGSGKYWTYYLNNRREKTSFIKVIVGYAYSREQLCVMERTVVEENSPKFNYYLKDKNERDNDRFFRDYCTSDIRRCVVEKAV